MHRFIFDWFELERIEKAAASGELDEELEDIDLADIKRNKLIMYKIYQDLIEKRMETVKDFWEAVYPIDATRASLVDKYGEEAVSEVEADAYEVRLMLTDIERSLKATWDEFADPEYDVMADESGRIVLKTEEPKRIEGNASIGDIIKKHGFTKKHISVVGLAASAVADVSGDYERENGESAERRASINYEKFANRLVNKNDPFDAKFIANIHNLSIKAVREGLVEYDNGNPAKLGKLLREGIKKTSEMFADARDPKDATKRAGQLKEMLDIVEGYPDIAKAVNLNEEERSAAYGAVSMGEIISKGLRALNNMQNAALSMTELPDNIKDSYSQDIFQMQFVLNDRNKQIEIFRDSPGMKLPPSDLQKGIGNNARVKDLKTGKWPKLVEDIRTAIKDTDEYKRATRTSTFCAAHMMGNDRRRNVSMGKILKEIVSKRKMEKERIKGDSLGTAAAKKEQREATLILGAPVIGGASLKDKNE